MVKSIKIRMLLIFSGLILLSGMLIGYVSIDASGTLIKETVSEQAAGISKRAAGSINISEYENLLTEKDHSYYEKLRQELNEIREANGLTYLYTMKREKAGDTYRYFYIVDGMPADSEDASNFEEEETNIAEFPAIVRAFETGKTEVEMTNTAEYGGLVSAYVPIKSQSGEVIGIVGSDFDVTGVYSAITANELKMLLIMGIILVISVLITFAVTNSITKPIQVLSKNAEALGGGDLSVSIASNRRDEIGKLTSSFNKMLEDLRGIIQSLNDYTTQLSDTSSELILQAAETKAASREIAGTIEEISANSSAQFQSMSESVKVIEEMSAGVNHIAESSAKASDLANGTISEVNQGNQKLAKVISQMETISQSVNTSSAQILTLKEHSDEISAIVGIINGISSQTNLLALNAAIEAARAGESGKGFAVVAEEVRKLAEQSARSTASIEALIERINGQTKNTAAAMEVVLQDVQHGKDAVLEAGGVFQLITSSIEGVASQIEEVTATSQEMSASAEEIAAAAVESAEIAQQAAISTEQTVTITNRQDHLISNMAQSVGRLSDMSVKLNELTGKFKL